MKGVILAAGMGRRLLPITENLPKCLVLLRGKPLILHQLDALADCNIKKIVLVVGYKKELVQKEIGDVYRGIPIEYVINDDYATTNNIYSLWLAREHLVDDDVLLMECDIVFQKELILRLLECEKDAVVLVDRFELGMDGTVVRVGEDGVITRLVTRSEQSDKFDFGATHKTVNVYKFSKSFLANVFVPSLDLYVKSRGITSYYELVLAVLVYLGSPAIRALPVTHLKWYEIDDENDLERAEYVFSSPRERLQKVEQVYGGFWRYNFTDFCYLTNPYFPTDSMIAEMKYQLHALISNYPSGQEELDEQMSRIFHVSSKSIVAGNGSSQLIQVLAKNLGETSVAIPLPSFNEYERVLGKRRVVPYFTERDQFQLSLKRYAKHIKENKTESAILVSPDNPTGYALRRNNLIAFLDSIQDEVQLLMLDESFTDLVDGAGKNTLLQQQILDHYPFVAIVRSLSKEFGVAGLRIGLLGSGNTELVSNVREALPIWNVNCLAQFFMESFLKYREEHRLSCEKIIENRNNLYAELTHISFLKPYPSFANFVFCEVAGEWTASSLRDVLFTRHNILIKDCSNKSGLKTDRYVRIASRTSEENRSLLNVLRSLAA